MLADLLFGVHLWTALAVVAGVYYFLVRPKTAAGFPVSSATPAELQQDARRVITESLAKSGGAPVIVRRAHDTKLLLPASLAGWVKSNRDLDHPQHVREDYFAGLPGFEANTILHGDETAKRMITTKLGQNDSIMAAMNASLGRALDLLWGSAGDWHAIDWNSDTTGVIARAASAVFVGPEKCDDAEWLGLIQSYVGGYFASVAALHNYPVWARRLAHRFLLPGSKACREILPRARAIIDEVASKRRREAEEATRQGKKAPAYNDAIEWSQRAAGNNGPVDLGGLQLSLAMAALLTTSEMLRAVLVDIARHTELVEPLRNEIEAQIKAHGISVAATNNMVLLDSVLKESQRLASGLVVLERTALRDTRLPSGQLVPRGTHLMVDSTGLWDPAIFPDPERFDGYRFLRSRERDPSSSAGNQFVQSGPNYHVFGGGKFICPGRFFAANELKLVLAHILLKYDVRLAKECGNTQPLLHGVYAMVNPTVKFEVKRRKDGAANTFF
ncbi:ent-kaurene oxidase [Magnaporthiopsis poae ATCC 64411]|uniref:Ent-kaurene oxidase n=1 Tax=Magnaporthiopsis poae (strain ATCC 64411 / 73-15) TaxID=644358 RepID=A0A0C4EC61_MAGP6|nr:ent-kaurene oxidase [Magnaporthiopsis poae ATCC 64411]